MKIIGNIMYIITFIAVFEIIYGIVIFINKIKKCKSREFVKLILKPGSLFILTTFLCYIVYYIYQPLLVTYEPMILIMIGVSLILISRYITIFVLNWKSKLISLVLAILFGITKSSMFWLLWHLITEPYDIRDYKGLVYLFFGAIVAIVSVSLNIFEVKKNFSKKGEK